MGAKVVEEIARLNPDRFPTGASRDLLHPRERLVVPAEEPRPEVTVPAGHDCA